MDQTKVHPKFLHSNTTRHKWAFEAVAGLLNNSIYGLSSGDTYVNIDMLKNQKDRSAMLLIQDSGAGIDSDKLQRYMSFGYSMAGTSENSIGQYGNGFLASTIRLGADAIVFTRSLGKWGSLKQSIGMFSYTLMMNMSKEDIVIPMIDYEKEGQSWRRSERSGSLVWNENLETILRWSPYVSEADLLQQFGTINDQGTRIVIYNLWEDDEGKLELDFDADEHDIQIRGVNRDKMIQVAQQFPSPFRAIHHSLRSYLSIRYPPGFRIILRDKDIEHNISLEDIFIKEEPYMDEKEEKEELQLRQTLMNRLLHESQYVRDLNKPEAERMKVVEEKRSVLIKVAEALKEKVSQQVRQVEYMKKKLKEVHSQTQDMVSEVNEQNTCKLEETVLN